MASGLENARLVPKVIGRAAARTCFIQNAVEHVPWTWTNTVHCNAHCTNALQISAKVQNISLCVARGQDQ